MVDILTQDLVPLFGETDQSQPTINMEPGKGGQPARTCKKNGLVLPKTLYLPFSLVDSQGSLGSDLETWALNVGCKVEDLAP